ncbi:hypothetical protein BG005_005705 [Podila minutissima]|nr:hypothetical protein BG005_005705 [Podila minutissima]
MTWIETRTRTVMAVSVTATITEKAATMMYMAIFTVAYAGTKTIAMAVSWTPIDGSFEGRDDVARKAAVQVEAGAG